MFWKLAAYLPFIFAAPAVQLELEDSALPAATVRMAGQDDLLEKCLKSGFPFEYAFKVRICKRRPLWFDTCRERRLEKHRLKFDVISGIFRLEVDRFDDNKDPAVKNYTSLSEAAGEFSAVKQLPLLFLARGRKDYLHSRRSYLSARVSSKCLGEYSETLADISSVMTFGLVRINGFDTGWVDFTFERSGVR